ncbi:Vegetative incompatibility protein HET-E-1 [Gracilariopsis chorda]|uniref:Vegetative incompatibility protein HET-E-1 n=1 Tax=Gracilariopsis chorda TaxID=448386 RepID=A0A2V3ISC2_9FLOR|nr:Vegetative incompatibility protein HET-E-1 [Gracilariopsis chorda]|eukprot:PXF45025.1 Vegetative incompatibility protein HET-E-1 [Gracilariopsis chorda]
MEYVALVAPVVKVVEKLEAIVNRYYERGDIIEDNRRQLGRLIRQYAEAAEILRQLETSKHFEIDRVTSARLRLFKIDLEEDGKTLEQWKEPINKAKRTKRVRRMKDVLDECEARSKEFFEFLNDKISPMLSSQPMRQDYYKARNTVPRNPPRLILNYNRSDTCEGKLKDAVLCKEEGQVVAVLACGQGGVGKTCALRGLAGETEVKSAFPGGLLYIQLGNDATMKSIVEGIATVVDKTGGEQLAKSIREMPLAKAAEKASDWFCAHTCLFLVDDIWRVNGIDSGVLTTLESMMNEKSRMIYTSRDERFLNRAHTRIEFRKKDTHGELSRRMLMKHAGYDAECDLSEENKNAFEAILDMCDGLPLAHGIAGRSVWNISRTKSAEQKQDAWSKFHQGILSHRNDMYDVTMEGYGKLPKIVDASLEVLERCNSRGRYCERFRALCVLQKQERVSTRMLQKLWDTENLADAERVVDRFKEVSIAQKREDGGLVYIQLHDIVLDIATRMAEGRSERHKIFRDLVYSYTPPLRWGDTSFEWWETEDDGYIHDNVCRLLWNTGHACQLMWLLSKPQWIAKRFVKKGIYAVEQDLKHGIALAENGNYGYANHKEHLDMVGRAARLAHTTVATNPREVWFQLHGRLLLHATKCEQTKKFVEEIEKCAPRPWVKGSLGILPAPGAAEEIIKLPVCASSITVEDDETWIFWRSDGGMGVSKHTRTSGVCDHHPLVMKEEDKPRLLDVDCETFAKMGDRRSFVTAHGNGRIVTWNRDTGEMEREVECLGYISDAVWMLIGFSCDGTRVASTSSQDDTRVWDTCSGEAMGAPLVGHTAFVICVAFSSNRNVLVTGSDDNTVRVWNAQSGEALTAPLVGHTDWVSCVAVSADGRRIVSGSRDKTVRVWNAQSGEALTAPLVGHTDWVSCVAVSADGTRIVSGSRDKTVRVWNAQSGEALTPPLVGHTASVVCVAVSADGTRIVSGALDKTVRVWNAQSGEALTVPPVGHTDWVSCVAVSADGKRIVSGSWDKTVRVWNAQSGEALTAPLVGHTDWVSCVAVSADGKRIVSGSWDKTVRVWNAESGEALTAPLVGHTDWVRCVAVSADGTRIVSGALDKTVRVWNAQSGEALTPRLVGHTHDVSYVAVSADGRRIVSGSRDKTVRVWNAESGEALTAPLVGHTDWVRCVAVSADGTRIVSGSWDKTVRVWNAEDGRSMFVQECEAKRVAVDAHGSKVVTVSRRDVSSLWDVSSGECAMTSTHAAWQPTVAALDLSWSQVQSWKFAGQREVRDGGEAGPLLATCECEVANFNGGDMYFSRDFDRRCRIIR